MTEEQKKSIEALYPDYSTSEISAKTGISVCAVRMYSYRHKLKHSDEGIKRIREKVNRCALSAIDRNTYHRIAEGRKIMVRKEKRRMIFGERRQTKIRVSILPIRIRLRMAYMCNIYNYFRDTDINKAVLYYDKETKRSMLSEKRAIEKYGIKFEEADE